MILQAERLIKIAVDRIVGTLWFVHDEMGRRYTVNASDVSASNSAFWAWSHKMRVIE